MPAGMQAKITALRRAVFFGNTQHLRACPRRNQRGGWHRLCRCSRAAATVSGGWRLASRAGPFAGKPAPTAVCVQPRDVSTTNLCRSGFTREYGGGGNGERRGNWPAGPALSRVNPLLQWAVSNHRCVSTTHLCRSGFTREYGGGSNSEWRVEIGQQGRPLRG